MGKRKEKREPSNCCSESIFFLTVQQVSFRPLESAQTRKIPPFLFHPDSSPWRQFVSQHLGIETNLQQESRWFIVSLWSYLLLLFLNQPFMLFAISCSVSKQPLPPDIFWKPLTSVEMCIIRRAWCSPGQLKDRTWGLGSLCTIPALELRFLNNCTFDIPATTLNQFLLNYP